MTKAYAAIIPVAGLSSRMGSFKPLLELDGSSMIERTVQSVLAGGAQSVCVVTGRDAHKVEAALSKLCCEFLPDGEGEASSDPLGSPLFCVHNPQYAESDMLHSIKLGLAALCGDRCASQPPDAVFVIPGDMPGVSPGTFALLRKSWEAGEANDAVFVPTYHGRRGHPLLIGKACFDAVLGFEGEGGLRRALADFGWCEVSTNDPGTLLDADTPDDFDKLAAHMRIRHATT